MLVLSKFLCSFSTTLQILSRNRNQLKLINKNLIVKQQARLPQQKLLPYMSISYEYIQSNHLRISDNFKQLDVFKNKLRANPALANGEQYQQYPLPKILHICLKMIQQQKQNIDKGKWDKLERRVTFLLRNTSAIDNILLLYISMHRFSTQLQSQIIRLLQQQTKVMTQMQRQFLFYTICQVKYKVQQNVHMARLNKLKDQLSLSIHKSKLNMSNLIQWIILISITNPSTLQILIKNLQKVHLYSKYILTPQQFVSLIKCIDYRRTLTDFITSQQLKKEANRIINLYKSTVSNHHILINTLPQQPKLKLLLSYYNYNHNDNSSNNNNNINNTINNNESTQNFVIIQQLNSSTVGTPQMLRYLHKLWNNQSLQQYHIKSLYQSIQFHQISTLSNKFSQIDTVYYICWLQMGLNYYSQYPIVIQICNNLQYIPRGLEWPLWNYLARIVKQKVTLTTENKLAIQSIITKIQKVQEKRSKNKLVKQQIQKVKSNQDIQQLSKFLNSIKAWIFQMCQPVGDVDFIAHFVSHDLKIILNCINQSQLIEQSIIINSQHNLNKKLMKQNFGYSIVDVNVKQILALNYNQRVQWLRDSINNIGQIAGKIAN